MKKILIVIIFFIPAFTIAQSGYYSSPMKIPMLLSASFAELRSNHFHSGIDIKTNQTTGIPVNSVADGYISRIVVSPSGFGKALYIEHPNGTSSVYAHLDQFRNDIQKYVENKQYELQSYRVDLAVPRTAFPVIRDQLIAYSGNSGSSGGPHLHFEIRDSRTEEPLNPLGYGFPVADTVAPRIMSVMLVPLNSYSHVNYKNQKSEFQVERKGNRYKLKDTSAISVYGEIGIAILSNDFAQNTNNRYGINTMNMKVDGEPWFSVKLDRFSFAESRAINSYIDYAEYIESQRRFQKLWIEPGNKLSIYNYSRNKGVISLRDGNPHPVKIELTDSYGNLAVLEFTLKGNYTSLPPNEENAGQIFYHNRSNEFNSEALYLDVPEGALYTDMIFRHQTKPAGKGFYSRLHRLHNEKVPLHKSATVKIKAEGLPERLEPKALLVNVDPKTGRKSAAGGIYEEGLVVSSIRNFGDYAIAVDTLAPKIVPLSIETGSKLTESKRIRFRISDELAGIDKIEGYLNGKWMLFEYDAKYNLITHTFDPERFELNRRHQFELHVTDYKGNTNTYEASFWK